ncbi:MAG: hypothetical protein V3V16_12050 [Melioribacteraceae bacterium]
MKTGEYIWAAVIIFSTISFAYMSVKVIYKGLGELKEMLRNLGK